jgi:RNA polymerase sigma-70 factor (ECF subfamily)
MSSGEPSDEDRVDMQRLAAGQDAALNRLMERHSERLFRFLVRELQNESEAADLAEEVFVRVYQNCHRFDLERKFTTWLYAIAMNLVRDRGRWRSRHPEVSIDAPSTDPEADWLGRLPDQKPTPGESLEQSERAQAVRRALRELPDDLRTPLILAEYEGLSHGEIGEVLNCSAKAVEMRVYRARQQLRKQLANLCAPA